MGVGSFVAKADEGLTDLVGSWNGYSTAIITALVLIISYSIATRVDPDIHPFLLARQSKASNVRNERESPVYRGHSAPHGMPLNSGLNVKEAGASKWSRGRDGDLRDIWRRAVSGPPEGEGPKGLGKILTVLGREQVIEHKSSDITRQINLIGQHITQHGGSKVAIYLPNSVEYIATLFACSFYNLTAVLLPFDESNSTVISALQRSAVDTVVTAPGAFPFDSVVKSYPALRQLIWVVDEGSKHLDWNEVPKGIGGSVNVATWQDILNDNPVDAGTELPSSDPSSIPKDIVTFWKTKTGDIEEMVQFSHANFAAGISAQLTGIPGNQRLTPSDLYLPAAPLSDTYTLILTLAALFSNASVAFNSVAGASNDIVLATAGIAPTVISTTPETLLKTYAESSGKLGSAISRTVHWLQTQSLVQNGVMPVATAVSRFNDSLRPSIGTKPGKLRLLFVAERAGASTPALNERVLSDLRVLTGARIVYALTTARVAGAVTQTGIYDYRVTGEGKETHFGAPVSSTEVVLKDKGADITTDEKSEGEVYVRGPAVVGGEASLGVVGKVRHDGTLAYI